MGVAPQIRVPHLREAKVGIAPKERPVKLTTNNKGNE